MRISELSPVVAALAIVLLFSPLGASQVQVDVDEPRLQSLDTTHDKRSTQQQQQQQQKQKIPKEDLKSSRGSGSMTESRDRGEELHATGSGPGRPNEESSIPLLINETEKTTIPLNINETEKMAIPLHIDETEKATIPLHINETKKTTIPLNINETEKTTRYQEDSETADVNDERYVEAASPDTDLQQNVKAEMAHTSDSEKHAERGDHVGGKEKRVESESSIDQAQNHTTSPEEHEVNTSNTRGSQDNRQEASKKGPTAQDEDYARPEPIINATIKKESKSTESSSEEATGENIDGEDDSHTESIPEQHAVNQDANSNATSDNENAASKRQFKSAESSDEEATGENIDGEDGSHTESIPEQHAVTQDADSNVTSDDEDAASECPSDEAPTIKEAEPSKQRSHDKGATIESSSEAPSDSIAGTEDIRNEPQVDKEPTATEQIQNATVEQAIKPEETESDIIDLDDDIGDSSGKKETFGGPKVDKEPAATEQIEKATVDKAIKPEDVESDIIDLDHDDDISDSSENTEAHGGDPADDADANSSSDDPTPTSDEKDTPGEKDPIIDSDAAPKGSLAEFFNKVNKNKGAPSEKEGLQAAASNSFEHKAKLAQQAQSVVPSGKEGSQAAASNSFEHKAKLAQQAQSVDQESPPPPPKKAAPVEEMEYSGTWGLYLQNERPADLDLLSMVFQDHLNRQAGGSYESKMKEARFPLGMGTHDEENEADVTSQQEGVASIKKSVNSEFVEGLDDIGKFFEGVDPPDELDVGAGGSSIQDVLMGQGRQILFKRIMLAFQKIRRAFASTKDKISSTKNNIASTWTSLETRFRSGEDGKFSVKKEDVADGAKELWNLCVAAYRFIVKFIDDLLEGDDGSDDLDDFELDFKSKINLRDPVLNMDLGQS